MAGINSLLSTLQPTPLQVGGAPSTGRVPTAPQGSEQAPPQTGLGGDSFAQGQWWKNRSQAATSDEAAGDWRAQAAVRAYGAQAGNGVGMPADVTDAAGAGAAAGEGAAGEAAEGAAEEGVAEGEGPAAEQTATGKDQALTPEEQRVVTQLQVRDVQVRAHEQAHLAAAGGYAASGASFQYQRGPDGRKYAVGGEVQIDVSGESDPEKTIRKMNVVRSAALAPADPSAQDRRVAARAAAGIVDAQGELYKLREEEAAVKREEAAQRREASGQEAAGGAAGASADTTGSVSGGIRLSVRGYGDSGGSMGGDNAAGQGRRGFNRIV